MNINFKCETNKDYVAINTLVIKLRNGGVIQVDRDQTEYDIQGLDLDMTWRNCYLWTLNDKNIFGEEGYYITEETSVEDFKELISNATYSFLLEEDMDEDYIVQIRSMEIN